MVNLSEVSTDSRLSEQQGNSRIDVPRENIVNARIISHYRIISMALTILSFRAEYAAWSPDFIVDYPVIALAALTWRSFRPETQHTLYVDNQTDRSIVPSTMPRSHHANSDLSDTQSVRHSRI